MIVKESTGSRKQQLKEASGMTPRVKEAIDRIKAEHKSGDYILTSELSDDYGISAQTLVKYGVVDSNRGFYYSVVTDKVPMSMEDVVDVLNEFVDSYGGDEYRLGKDGKIYQVTTDSAVKVL